VRIRRIVAKIVGKIPILSMVPVMIEVLLSK
jgi:hypothetical protein